MKKTILIVAMALAVSTVFAQEQIRFGLRGGLNMASISTEKNGEIKDNSIIPTFNAGVFMDLPVAGKVLSLQPGISFAGRGTKSVIEGTVLGSTANFTATSLAYYVDGRLDLMFKIPLESFRIFVGAGPYLGYGVSGYTKFDGTLGDIKYDGKKEDINFTNDKQTLEPDGYYTAMKPWDYGLNITAGIEISSFVLSANYGHGLSKIRPAAEDANSTDSQKRDDAGKHRVLGVSVGFLF